MKKRGWTALLLALLMAACLLPAATTAEETDPEPFYFCGFETLEENGRWSFLDADGDGYNFVADLNDAYISSYCYEGKGLLLSESYINYVDALTPDNYAVSPAISIPENEEDAMLSWYVAGQDVVAFAEYYSVYVYTGTEKLTVENVETLLKDSEVLSETVTTGAKNYLKKAVHLSGMAGKTVQIVFRHHNVTDQFRLDIDNVTLEPFFTSAVLTPESLDFGVIWLGDEVPAPTQCTMESSGSGPIAALSVSLSGENADCFTLDTSDMANTLNPKGCLGATTAFTVNIKDGLEIGSYEALLTVCDGDQTLLTRPVHVVVRQRMDASISPESAVFLRVNPDAVEVTKKDGDYTLNAIQNGESPLLNTDYQIDGDTVRISTAYLETLPLGKTTLTFDYGMESNPTLTVMVVTDRLAGDANCDESIYANDASAILRSIAGLDTLSPLGRLNADCDGVSGVTAADASQILRYIVELIPSLH